MIVNGQGKTCKVLTERQTELLNMYVKKQNMSLLRFLFEVLNESISVRLLGAACRVAKQFCFYWLPVTSDLHGGQISGIECVVLKETCLYSLVGFI